MNQTRVGVRHFIKMTRALRGRDGGVSAKEGARIVVSATTLLALQGVHRAALALDEILYPEFKRVEIRAPFFIVGPPRSGSTLSHHLLTHDRARSTTFHLWELILAPPILEKKALLGLARIDRRLGGPGRAPLGKRCRSLTWTPYSVAPLQHRSGCPIPAHTAMTSSASASAARS